MDISITAGTDPKPNSAKWSIIGICGMRKIRNLHYMSSCRYRISRMSFGWMWANLCGYSGPNEIQDNLLIVGFTTNHNGTPNSRTEYCDDRSVLGICRHQKTCS